LASLQFGPRVFVTVMPFNSR